ncbi:molybdopterin-guanine dinucleotide biosynthesis protein B [Cohnella phaseoli]|uniref:Molybdopterin-guanine dinucleotide biosynthesis protein MobB n=1 Tax=Cohnella phaseoli TaxID=456490 RepID=A0A3D9KDX5_9BACL|nr:molybdopterin-guanine dinucleotide biosynthesis protein B [Cohnella phaseoli]RED84330.1 molybdopterin-guanine dinucleotide biosynthesis protein MobB [Cohnella phaseoli]
MRIIQIVGYKNSGKTTLACELIRAFAAEDRKVGTLKHDAHQFEPEPPGTDTWKHRQAGSSTTAIVSAERTAWVVERTTSIEELVSQMTLQRLDDLIVEGFKSAPYPKIALIREEEDADLLQLSNVIAVALRKPLPSVEKRAREMRIPVFLHSSLDSFEPLLAFLRQEPMELMTSWEIKGMKKGLKEGREEGIKAGIIKGKAEGKQEIAVKMLQKGFETPTIHELTGLSRQKIQKLKEAMQQWN